MNSNIGSDVMFESLARVFLVKLIGKYGLEIEEDKEFSGSFTSRHYKRVLDYVAGHFARKITLEDLAAEAGLSPYHFSRLFKVTIGQSPHQIVMAYRVDQAKKMLEDKSRPMIDIALSCGFSDQAHFSRVFKSLAGCSPRSWRERH